MDQINLDVYHFLIFIIPGFIVVWTFRYFTGSKKDGDFEFLGLSFFWGLVVLMLFILINELSADAKKAALKLLENPYAAAFVLSVFAVAIGWVGSEIVNSKWFKKIKNLRPIDKN